MLLCGTHNLVFMQVRFHSRSNWQQVLSWPCSSAGYGKVRHCTPLLFFWAFYLSKHQIVTCSTILFAMAGKLLQPMALLAIIGITCSQWRRH
ncbi:Gamma-glutamylcyclotransferase 2-2 [Zea mays]|uniref:Gamma-glutamylcyclotransferase 2-2 n=1 Tax=Zea mays TaxID=4577 RepID=A0A1D6H801_MAIZE|nr:Gamma-glutamylcyclotransferase 2-2 [Zea mays]